MFVKRKLNKTRKEAKRYVRRARRQIENDPERFDTLFAAKLKGQAEALEQTMAGDDLALIERDLKAFKRNVDSRLPFHRTSIVREYVEMIVFALVLALVIRTFVIQAFKIPSGSMIPTLRVGDHILVSKFVYGVPIPFTEKKIPLGEPERGDIVVFKFPNDPSKDYIKRVIGLPGDTIAVRGTELYINDELVSKEVVGEYRHEDPVGYPHTSVLYEERIDGEAHKVLYDEQALRLGDIVRKVPEGHYFCMGDNRDHSNDSRYWGFVPAEYLKGKALIIYFSWPPGQLLRIGKILH